MASDSIPASEYAGIDEYVPVLINRRRQVRGQSQALVSWKTSWTSCTDPQDPLFETVAAIIRRARNATLVRWKPSWELESDVSWVPTATANPESSGGSDGPIGDDGGDDSGDDGANHGAGPDATGTAPGVEDSTSSNITGRRLMTPSRRLLESLASLPVSMSSSSPCAITSTVPANRAVPGPSPRLAPSSAARGTTVASVQPFDVSADVDATVPARGSSVAAPSVLHVSVPLVAKLAASRKSNSSKGRSTIGGNKANTDSNGSISASSASSSSRSSISSSILK